MGARNCFPQTPPIILSLFSYNLVVERGNVDLVRSSHKEKFPYCQSHFYPYRLVALVGIVGAFP